jgi:hypothetical protein
VRAAGGLPALEMSIVNRPDPEQLGTLRTWALWTAHFIAFPLAGLAGTAAGGRVDAPLAALLGGSVAGLVIGVAQVLASHGRLTFARWVPATALGMGGGLALGAANAEYGTTLQSLMLMGLVTGMVLGAAQAFALPRRARHRWLWAGAMPLMWAVGWGVTTAGGLDLSRQNTVFGLSGALVFTAVSGLLLERLLPDVVADVPEPNPAPVVATA